MDIDSYIAQHSSDEPPVLQELTRATHLRAIHPRMLSGHVQGRVLAMLTSIIRPRRVLELGTFTAYSTIAMALEMEAQSELITIEIDDELEDIAAEFIAKAGVQNIVSQRIGDALDVLPTLQPTAVGLNTAFDMVFIDADKRKYEQYYNSLFDNRLVASGSLILADNTLWDSKVLREIDKKDMQTAGVVAFNRLIKSDSRVEKVILPLRDGLTLIRVK